MDAKVFTYIFLVFVTLILQKTSAQCTITITESAQLNRYGCYMRQDPVPPELQGDIGSSIVPTSEDSKRRILRNVQANTSTSTESTDEFGTKDWPAEALCKFAPRELESGTYYLGPTGKPMTVYCNMVTRETCIRTSKTTPEFNHDPSKGAFWLHEENVRLTNLYTDISVEQLTWLRDRAGSVRQTLKYNCLDSVPHSKYNESSSVKLRAWNALVIGPNPTNQSPLFYSIPEATDKCVEGNTEWQSTIIELQSFNVYRLPVVDMWIGDIRNEKQKVTIESVELCFA